MHNVLLVSDQQLTNVVHVIHLTLYSELNVLQADSNIKDVICQMIGLDNHGHGHHVTVMLSLHALLALTIH